MKSRLIVLCLAVCGWCGVFARGAATEPAPATAPVAAPAPSNVLAHATGKQVWIGWVRPVDDHIQPTFERTEVFSRGIMGVGGAEWAQLNSIDQRVTSMASIGSELALLAADGSWSISSTDGDLRTGPPAPMGVRFLCFGDDGNDLWAVGDVGGGLASLNHPPALATRPTTEPTTQAATRPTDEMALFQFDGASWIARPPALPIHGLTDVSRLSLTVVKGTPWLAIAGATGHLYLFSRHDDQWWPAPKVSPTITSGGAFKLLSQTPYPWLWVAADGQGWGDLYYDKEFSKHVELAASHWPGKVQSRTIIEAGGIIQLILLTEDGKLMEQQFEGDGSQSTDPGEAAKFGQPVGDVAPVPLPGAPPIDLQPWVLIGVAMIAVAVSSSVSHRRRAAVLAAQTAQTPAGNAASTDERQPWAEGPPTAPLRLRLATASLRLAAGAVDATPILLWSGILMDTSGSAAPTLMDLRIYVPLAVALAAYIVHTTLAEVICGVSLGKMLFGLKVVGLDGKPVTRRQSLIRNLLRVCDLVVFPLVLVLFSPLRQRLGDLVAKTVVIEPDAPAEKDGEEQ